MPTKDKVRFLCDYHISTDELPNRRKVQTKDCFVIRIYNYMYSTLKTQLYFIVAYSLMKLIAAYSLITWKIYENVDVSCGNGPLYIH